MNFPKYGIVTPIKNEEKYISDLIESVMNQTIPPNIWIIIDDGSTDNSSNILKSMEKKYSELKIIRNYNFGKRDLGIHYSKICKYAFDELIRRSKQEGIIIEYIALSDADMKYPNNYFEILIDFFKNNEDYGIISGIIKSKKKNGKYIIESKNFNRPRGTGRMWTYKCFIDSSGYIIGKSPDSISNIKALKRGWKICVVQNAVCYQQRETSSADGKLKGYYNLGNRQYYLHTPLFSAILGSIKISLKSPFISGIFYLLGYLKGQILKEERIQDQDIMDYKKKIG